MYLEYWHGEDQRAKPLVSRPPCYLKAGARRDGCHVEGVGIQVSREFTELLESMEFESTRHTGKGAHSSFATAISMASMAVLGKGMLLLLIACNLVDLHVIQ